MSGIYMILCRPTGEYYLGATTRPFETRFVEHRTQLGRGVCTIPILQQRAKEYGVEALEFTALKEFPISELLAREQEALALLKPALNICHVRMKGSYQRWDRIEIEGREYTVAEASREFGVLARTIRFRIERGLTGLSLVAPPHKTPRKEYVRHL